MSLFYGNYGCHVGALLLHKRTGVVYRARWGNIGMWDMTAVLVPNDIVDEVNEDGTIVDGILTTTPDKMKRDYLILDEGEDPWPKSLLAPPLKASARPR